MSCAMFDSKLLSSVMLTVQEVEAFKKQAVEVVRYDEETRYRITAYIHEDGRVLLGDIKLLT